MKTIMLTSFAILIAASVLRTQEVKKKPTESQDRQEEQFQEKEYHPKNDPFIDDYGNGSTTNLNLNR